MVTEISLAKLNQRQFENQSLNTATSDNEVLNSYVCDYCENVMIYLTPCRQIINGQYEPGNSKTKQRLKEQGKKLFRAQPMV